MTSQALQGHGRSHNSRIGSTGRDPIPDLQQALTDIAALQAAGSGLLTGKNDSDFISNADTTLSDVPGLSVALEANSVYQITASISYHSGNTPDFKYGFTTPTGSVGQVWAHYLDLAATNASSLYDIAISGVTAFGNGAGSANRLSIRIAGHIVTTNAGSLQFQAAQNTNDASDTVVMAGSNIVAVPIP